MSFVAEAPLKILIVDTKWGVVYDTSRNDKPLYWLRNNELHSPWDENNAVTAMFYALLGVD